MIIVALITAVFFTGCKKDSNNNNSNTICKTAKVTYAGDPAADGLGWILVTDTSANTFKYEAPENLSDEFKQNGRWVAVCYFYTNNDFACFCQPPFQKTVHITSITAH